MDGHRINNRPVYVRPTQDAYYNLYGTVRGNPTGKIRPALHMDNPPSKKTFNFLPWKKGKSKTDEFLHQQNGNLSRHDKYKFGSVSALSSSCMYREWEANVPYGDILATDLKHASVRSVGVRPRSSIAYPWESYHNNSIDEKFSSTRHTGQFSLSHSSGDKMKQNMFVRDEPLLFKQTGCSCEKKKKSGPFGTLNFKSSKPSKCNCGFSSVRSSAGFVPPAPPRRKSILPNKVDLYAVHEDQTVSLSRPNSRLSNSNNTDSFSLTNKCKVPDDSLYQVKPHSKTTSQEKFLRTLNNSVKKDSFNSVASRKSILECDVTAYDLVKSYLKSTEEVDTDLDDDLSDNAIEGSKAESGKHRPASSMSSVSKKSVNVTSGTKFTNSAVKEKSPSPVSSESESGIYSQPPSIRIGGHGMKMQENNNGSQNSSLYSDGSKTNSVDSRTSSWSNGSISDDGIYSLPEPDYDHEKDNYETNSSSYNGYNRSPSFSRKFVNGVNSLPVTEPNVSNYRQYPSENKEPATVRRATSLVSLASRSDLEPGRGMQPGRIPTIPELPHVSNGPIPPPPPPPPPPPSRFDSKLSDISEIKENVAHETVKSTPSKNGSCPQNAVSSSIAAELSEKLRSDKPLLKKKPMEVKEPIKVNATNPYAEVKSILKKTSENKLISDSSITEPSPSPGPTKHSAIQEIQDIKKKKRVQFKSLSNESLVVDQIKHQSPCSSEEEWELNKSCTEKTPDEERQQGRCDDGFQTVSDFLNTPWKSNSISQLPRLSVKSNISSSPNSKGMKAEPGKKSEYRIPPKNGPIPRPTQPPPPPPNSRKSSPSPTSRPLTSTPKSLSVSDLRTNVSRFGDRGKSTGLVKTSIPIRQQNLTPASVFHSKGRPRLSPVDHLSTPGLQKKQESPPGQKNGQTSPAANTLITSLSRGKSIDKDNDNNTTSSQYQTNWEYHNPHLTNTDVNGNDSCDESTIDGSTIYEDCRSVMDNENCVRFPEKGKIDNELEENETFYDSTESFNGYGTLINNSNGSHDDENNPLYADTYHATKQDDVKSFVSLLDDDPLPYRQTQSYINPTPSGPNEYRELVLNGYDHNAEVCNTNLSVASENKHPEGPVFSNLLYVPCRSSPSPPPLPLSPPPIKVSQPSKVPPLPPQRDITTVLSDNLYEQPRYITRFELPKAEVSISCHQALELSNNFRNKEKTSEIYESRRCSDTGATIVTISTNGEMDSPEHIYEELPSLLHSNTNLQDVNPFGRYRRSFFEGASKAEILKYLEGAKDRVVQQIVEDDGETSLLEEDEDEVPPSKNTSIQNFRNNPIRISNISSSSESSTLSSISRNSTTSEDSGTMKISRPMGPTEVERADSGVGTETSRPHRLRKSHIQKEDEILCADCDQRMAAPPEENTNESMWCPLVCSKCDKKRSERKEIVTEIVETEFKYGKDLMIIHEEFFSPMEVAALLTRDQLNGIFLNLSELILVNRHFSEKLKDAVDIATEQGDEDYTTVNIGKLFLETSTMLQAFEVYCIQQGSASVLLSNLEKEKELLRIFLKVSQMENSLLRRMNLSAFLMVPVQRVTKYPLLLNRLYKVTPYHHLDREALREAQLKIELHLDHINQQTKGVTGTKIWRRLSNISAPHRRVVSVSDIGSIQFRKMAMEILQWSKEEIRFVMAGRLGFSNAPDFTKSRRGKTFKFTPSHALLATLGKPNSNYRPDLAHDDTIMFPRETGIRDATLLLMKEKNGKYSLAREPLHLGSCVVSAELEEEEDIIEIQEYVTKESIYLKAECKTEAMDWLKQLRYHAKDLGTWRRRRNALANIMINGMIRQ